MKLIINTPNDEIGWKEFNTKFSLLQKELVLLSIRELNLDIDTKGKILSQIIDKLKERLID